jgi:hypothetical protein
MASSQAPFSPIALRLMHAAGLISSPTEEGFAIKAEGGRYSEEFGQILRAMLIIGNAKVDQYGDFRLQDIRSWDRETWGAYWDIQRKFGRLENQLALVSDGDSMVRHHVTDLMETLSDQAVYCVRMIQILLRLEEKGLVPDHARTDHRNK